MTKEQEQQNPLTRSEMNENELMLNEMGKMAKVGGWSIDLKTNILTWTNELYKIHEVDENFVPTVESAINFYDDSSQEIISSLLNETIKSGAPYDTNLKLITAKGNKIDVRAIGKAIKNDKGVIEQVFGSFQNITDQKKKDRALISAKERFELAMKASGEGLFDWDLVTNEIYYSPRWKNMLGYQDHELPNDFSVWENLTEPEDVKNFWEMQQELISNKIDRFECELKMKHKKGHWVTILSRAEAIFNKEGKAIRMIGTHVDITEKVKTENRLKNNEYKFRILADNTNDWEYWINQNNEYVFISKSCKSITGYSKEEFLKSPDLFMDLVREDYKEEVFNHYHAKDRTGPLHTSEFPIINKDNKEVWIQHKCNPIFDEEGQFLGRRGNNRDITEKKISEIESKKLTKVVEQTPNSIVITDTNGIIEYINPKFTELTGYTQDEALGKKPNILSSGEQSKAFYADLWGTIIGGEVWKGRLHNKKKNGELYWEDATIAPIKNDVGETLNFLAIKNNITELKQKEEKLLQSDRVFNLAIDMFCIAGFDGYFKYLNPAWERTLGWSTEEMLSKPWIDFVHPDDIIKTDNVKSVIIDGQEIYQFVNRYICKDGSAKWLSWNSQPFPEENMMIGVARDITEAKRIENELIQAKEKAEESDRLKSAFLANMSHEIRTPMNGILGFTRLLDNANLSIEKQKKYIEILQISGKRLLNTVNDIVEISKIESGLVKIVKSEVDLIEYLNTTVTFFQPEAEKKGLQLIIQNEISENKLTIFTDKNKVSSIFSNLIKNAIKFTDRGTIEVGFKIEKNQILFSCKDSGIGIPKGRQKAIFDRFVQADIEDKQVREGSGLGLAIVKSNVEMLDGKIWVESEEGKGSEFFVSFPYNPINLKKNDLILKKNSSTDTKKNIHVLVAEDDEYSALHLSIIIKELAANVTLVENGIDAVEKCKNDSSIDLVLMDLKMPKMNGYKATQEIRKFNKEIVIIAQTAFVLEGDKQKAFDAGCTDYLSKPIKREKLVELINKYY